MVSGTVLSGGVLELTGMNKLSSDTAVDTAWAAIGSVFYVLDKRERKSGQLFQTDSPWTNRGRFKRG